MVIYAQLRSVSWRNREHVVYSAIFYVAVALIHINIFDHRFIIIFL